MWVELAGKDLVGMALIDESVTNLLYAGHTVFVIDLDIGLRSCNTKASPISSIVNCVELVIRVEHDVLYAVTLF